MNEHYTIQCPDETGATGDFYYIGIYPADYIRVSPTFSDLLKLFQWRDAQQVDEIV